MSIIQIKRSTANATPAALQPGELAFSYVSNTLFIGDSAGGVIDLFSNTSFAVNTAAAAYNQANLAYAAANTKLPLTGGTISGSLNVAQDMVVTGNLTILGDHTTINTVALNIDENVIYLSANTVGVPVLNNYVTVVRGTSSNTFLVWDEQADKWGWTDDGTNVRYFADVYALANTANNTANAAYTEANIAFSLASSANVLATAANTLANVANTTAAAAYATANAALPASGGTITGNLVINQNLTVTGLVSMTLDGGSF